MNNPPGPQLLDHNRCPSSSSVGSGKRLFFVGRVPLPTVFSTIADRTGGGVVTVDSNMVPKISRTLATTSRAGMGESRINCTISSTSRNHQSIPYPPVRLTEGGDLAANGSDLPFLGRFFVVAGLFHTWPIRVRQPNSLLLVPFCATERAVAVRQY